MVTIVLTSVALLYYMYHWFGVVCVNFIKVCSTWNKVTNTWRTTKYVNNTYVKVSPGEQNTQITIGMLSEVYTNWDA